MAILRTLTLAWLLATSLLAAPPAHAIDPPAPAAAPAAVADDQAGELRLFNRPVMRFRTPFFGVSAQTRALRTQALFDDIVQQGGPLAVTVRSHAEGQLVLLDGRLLFVVAPGDVDALAGQTPQAVAHEAAARLERVIADTRESRDTRALLHALAATAVATLVFGLLLWGLGWLRAALVRVLTRLAERKAANLRLGSLQVVESEHLAQLIGRLLLGLRWLLILVLSYEWVSFVLSRFPYTRPWGEQLNGYLLRLASSLFTAVVDALPGVGVALVIFVLARLFIGLSGRFFKRLSSARDAVGWLNPDTMPTTRRLFSIGVWLFAIAMAYPYLPGAQTDAFKGLSVLIGLMVSLGASSVVGQGAAGLILTYSRTLRKGDYVRVGDHEGTVIETGMFTTRLRTGVGEELTLPNSLITGGVTKNYSRRGAGYLVETTVTIGYDTPWRQVQAMLLEAAARTPGILTQPAPMVLQTELSDFYPAYRLVAQAQPAPPATRADVLSALHAEIQDVFNTYGVAIMSPHYVGDPDQAKMVPPEQWHLAPAKGQEG
ncbi:MAG: mechanosensitive ion channel family protein [Proteobacteria bacterium]|nr:mechanosensitive ion channel family protein [Pseudomonadota bacterium]